MYTVEYDERTVGVRQEEDYELETELLPIDRINSVVLREYEQLFLIKL